MCISILHQALITASSLEAPCFPIFILYSIDKINWLDLDQVVIVKSPGNKILFSISITSNNALTLFPYSMQGKLGSITVTFAKGQPAASSTTLTNISADGLPQKISISSSGDSKWVVVLLLWSLIEIKGKRWYFLFLSTFLLALCRPTGLMMAVGMGFIYLEGNGWFKLFYTCSERGCA
jgi:hypothetical protein